MSATSGIPASPELLSAFSDAVASPQSVRFLKISIKNELLVPDESIPPSGTLDEDLDRLGDHLEDDVPAYILARLDNPPTEWLAVFYVPDSAKVRNKMLYASTRSSLTKSLGSTPFTDSLFATSKADLTASAYAHHRASLAAPKPMSAREREMEEIKQAELRAGENGSGYAYEGSRARASHVGSGVGLKWSEEVESAVRELGEAEGEEGKVAVINIDTATETLVLSSVSETTPDELGSKLPPSDPSYALFVWPRHPRRYIIFIYSCPSSSPVKPRMLYSSGSAGVFQTAKSLLEDVSGAVLVSRKVETSDPTELNERHITQEVGHLLGEAESVDTPGSGSASGGATPMPAEEKKFAKPRGPARRVR